ncbi:MAG: tetratricopeptide repeat protein [Magnetovibrionaceae bacterium]
MVKTFILALSLLAISLPASAQPIEQIISSAQNGNSGSQFELGRAYHRGMGIEKDLIEARRWYKAAAEAGHVEAQFYYGWLFFNGRGVDADPAEAAKWFQLAANKGHLVSTFNMGRLYMAGSGVPQDVVRGYAYLLAAREKGHKDAEDMILEVSATLTEDQKAQAIALASQLTN